MTSVGAGYVIADENEPNVTIKNTLGRYHVCVRRTPTWKEIVAEFADEGHAYTFAGTLGPVERQPGVFIRLPPEHFEWMKRALEAYSKSLESSVPVVPEIRQWYERVEKVRRLLPDR